MVGGCFSGKDQELRFVSVDKITEPEQWIITIWMPYQSSW
jgi:hypothetical protein